MGLATAPPLLLRENDHDELVRLTRSSAGRAGLEARARIVLLASEGTPNVEIARLVGVSRPTVNLWRSRYVEAGVAGLVDEDRPGRPVVVDQLNFAMQLVPQGFRHSPHVRPRSARR